MWNEKGKGRKVDLTSSRTFWTRDKRMRKRQSYLSLKKKCIKKEKRWNVGQALHPQVRKRKREKQGNKGETRKKMHERGKDIIMAEPPPIGKDVVPRGFLAHFLLDNINVLNEINPPISITFWEFILFLIYLYSKLYLYNI